MKNGEYDERKYQERTELDLRRSDNETINAWMFGALKIKKKIKKHPQSGIRRFFNG